MGFSWPKVGTRPNEKVAVTTTTDEAQLSESEASVIRDGDLAFTLVQGGNGSKPSYQEAVGAPVESKSPLGYHVNWLTVIFLNINMMIGTGIFSTRKKITSYLG
jgi:hypothetical protein